MPKIIWKSLPLGVAAALMFAAPALSADGNTPPDPAAIQASSPALSVQGLYQQCTGDKVEQLYCFGYLTGMLESMMVVGSDNGSSARSFGICSKVAISPAAAVQAFKSWAEQHPEAWGEVRYIGVAFALQAHWPCA